MVLSVIQSKILEHHQNKDYHLYSIFPYKPKKINILDEKHKKTYLILRDSKSTEILHSINPEERITVIDHSP